MLLKQFSPCWAACKLCTPFQISRFLHSFRNGCLVMQLPSSQFCLCNSSLIFLEVTPTKLISSPRCTLMVTLCFLSRENRCLCIPRNSVIQHIWWLKDTDKTKGGLVEVIARSWLWVTKYATEADQSEEWASIGGIFFYLLWDNVPSFYNSSFHDPYNGCWDM